MLLIFIISGLILHSWLFIETHFNGIAFNRTALNGIVFSGIAFNEFTVDTLQPKNIVVLQIKTFYIIPFFFIKHLWMSNISTTAMVFFISSTKKSFEMFPKHKEYAAISESLALNLIISVPLTNK